MNCSFSGHTFNYFNAYGDIAKWYDHIAIQHNIHFILSSGNEGSLGVPTNTSYNAIVVGNCNNDGVIASNSSYISEGNVNYKPDIVAPGVDIRTPFDTDSGTLFAAPMVTSAVIQLSQASPILAANPTLMKSLLLSSSTITSSMQSEPMYSVVSSDAIALSRQYGAGRLSLTKAYESFVTKGNYITSSFSSNSTGAIFSRNITRAANKTLRFCLTWDKYNTVNGEHTGNNVNSPALDNLSLSVVTPSGITYTSNYLYDNKQVITFEATESGYYSIRVYREGTANSNNAVDYSITYSVY
ncbi:MAG: S8 family serine peptidase [Ruminococcus sp.]|nr:S8 family serine peptidase [Ruminococcus sp.]